MTWKKKRAIISVVVLGTVLCALIALARKYAGRVEHGYSDAFDKLSPGEHLAEAKRLLESPEAGGGFEAVRHLNAIPKNAPEYPEEQKLESRAFARMARERQERMAREEREDAEGTFGVLPLIPSVLSLVLSLAALVAPVVAARRGVGQRGTWLALMFASGFLFYVFSAASQLNLAGREMLAYDIGMVPAYAFFGTAAGGLFAACLWKKKA